MHLKHEVLTGKKKEYTCFNFNPIQINCNTCQAMKMWCDSLFPEKIQFIHYYKENAIVQVSYITWQVLPMFSLSLGCKRKEH